MLQLLSKILLTIIFLCIGSIHFYWAFGGLWAKQQAIPTTQDGVPLFDPGFGACLTVGLFFVALLTFNQVALSRFLPLLYERIVWGIIALVFLARAIGDLQYVGFFKKVTHTNFAYLDSLYYSPLCLLVFALILVKLAF